MLIVIKSKLNLNCKLNRNQTEPAIKIGAKQKSISRHESGATMPSIETLVKIAKVLKKPAGCFLEE